MARKANPIIASVVLLFCVYFMSCGVMSCYYWYRDVRENEGFIRAVFWSPIVGAFKATHWPYYAFFRDQPEEDQTPPAVTELRRAISYLNSAHSLMSGLATSSTPKEDIAAARELCRQSQVIAERINYSELNEVKPGMGDAVQEHYVKALTYYNSALAEDGDRLDLDRGDAAMARFNVWMERNEMGAE